MEHIGDDISGISKFSSGEPGGLLFIHTPSNLGGSDHTQMMMRVFYSEQHARNGYGKKKFDPNSNQSGFGLSLYSGIRMAMGK